MIDSRDPSLVLGNDLLSTIKASKHSLAIILSGSFNADMHTLVHQAVCELLMTRYLERHPNVIWLNAEDAAINVESIRALGSFLYSTAYYPALSKFAVIENVDSLNSQSLNALLKPLEDLASNTHIILTARALKSLPSTILSRCLQIRVKSTAIEVQLIGEALELYEKMLTLLNSEKHPSAKLYAFIEQNFASSQQMATFKMLMNHLMSKAIKFKSGVSYVVLNDKEREVIAALARNLSLSSIFDMLTSMRATLDDLESFSLDHKSVVLIILAKLIP
jgi:hypothetical protein